MDRRAFLRLASGPFLAGCIGRVPDRGAPDTTPEPPDCPARYDGDRVVCPDTGSGPIAVDRSPSEGTGGGWSLRVDVVNRSGNHYVADPFGWTVARWTSGRWVGDAEPGPGTHRVDLPPGGRLTWVLAEDASADADADHHVFVRLDPGRYALAVPFGGPDRVVAFTPFTV